VSRKVPESTVGRLSLYLRAVAELQHEGVQTASSDELARRAGTTAAQVRKDLSFFGTFGKRGLGYGVPELRETLRSILGLQRRWRVAVVGAGRIGGALLGHADLRRQGFDILAVFDRDPLKIGRSWNGVVVREVSTLESTLAAEPVDIAILAVPGEAANEIAERVVRAGVRAILNFASVKLTVPPEVAVKNVDMAVELEGLSFALAQAGNAERA
jgi:redox-sensing transcriptional repressor